MVQRKAVDHYRLSACCVEFWELLCHGEGAGFLNQRNSLEPGTAQKCVVSQPSAVGSQPPILKNALRNPA